MGTHRALCCAIVMLAALAGHPDLAGAGPGVAPERCGAPHVTSADGSTTFVTGTDSLSSAVTTAYDTTTGAVRWSQRYGGGVQPASLSSIVVGPGGKKVFVTGAITRTPTYSDYLTIAYDAATGTRLWTKLFDGASHTNDFAWDISIDHSGGRVFVTGESTHSGANVPGIRGEPTYNTDAVTIAYNARTGTRIWSRRFNGPANRLDSGRAIAANPRFDLVFVAGRSGNNGMTLAYNSWGELRWARMHLGPVGGYNWLNDVAAGPGGRRVFVAGSIATGRSRDSVAIAYDAFNGLLLWSARQRGHTPEGRIASAVAVSPHGGAVVVSGSAGHHAMTVAYSAHRGNWRWLRHYSDPDGEREFGTAVDISSDGTRASTIAFVYTPGPAANYSIAIDYSTKAGRRLSVRRCA